MPELPEVETIRRGLIPALKGRRIEKILVRRGDLRRPVPANFCLLFQGKVIQTLLRRGKYILALTEAGDGFAIHLGMSGRLKVFAQGAGEKFSAHDHVVFTLDAGCVIVFCDPRRFGAIFQVAKNWEAEKPFSAMGPEPLPKTFSAEIFLNSIAMKNAPVKNVLLDQTVVAGVGNIYACEALYHAGIDPRKPAKKISPAESKKIVESIRLVLKKAIAAGGSTLRDHRRTDGSEGYFQHGFSVYDRAGKPCPAPRCACRKTGGIRRIVQGGRSTFFCPEKQK